MPIVLNAKQFASYHAKLAARFRPAVMAGLHAGAAQAIPYLVERTRNASPANPAGIGGGGAVDTGGFIRAWKVLQSPDGATIVNTSAHGGVVEYGRRAGNKFPPRSALVPWIKRKLLTSGSREQGTSTGSRRRPQRFDTRRRKNRPGETVASMRRRRQALPSSATRIDRRRRAGKSLSADAMAERLYFPIARAIKRRGLLGRAILTAPEAGAAILGFVHDGVVESLNKAVAP